MKQTLIISLVIAVMTLIGYSIYALFMWGAPRLIYKQHSCDFANIDNVEMHAEIDIPRIDSFDCQYDRTSLTKTVCFYLAPRKETWRRYITVNKFIRVPENTLPDTADFRPSVIADASHAYFTTEGSYNDERWHTLLDSNALRLWVTIHYGKQ
ncbi:hypothetical protein [Rurimicrobium arvi]|uniref:DUF1254 domain-containing protein n=1 Tax=Rurimicrobium arvi TaxID=2049916 RepID=A0ABP8MSS8_9BACT